MVITGTATVNFNGPLIDDADLIVGTASSTIDAGQVTGSGTLYVLTNSSINLDSGAGNSFIVGQGTTGAVVQNSGSVVTTGENLYIGSGGTGTYTVNSGAILNLGTQGSPSTFYDVIVGTGSGTGDLLTIAGTLNAMNTDTGILVGNSGTGTISQTGTVNLGGANSGLYMGFSSGNGTYDLVSNNLNIGTNNTDTTTLDLGFEASSTGTLTQSGGTLTAGAATTVIIGDGGTGNYTLSGGTADFQNGFTVGNQSGSNGTITQSAGTTLSSEGPVLIGNDGTGTYLLKGGTFTSNAELSIGGTSGSLVQSSGSTLITNAELNIGGTSGTGTLTQVTGSTLTANGAFNIGTSGGTGIFDYNGGTLNLTSGIDIGSTGTFNQNASISLTNPVTQAITIASGGAYNLTTGTLITGGDTPSTEVFTGAGNFNFAGGTVAPSSFWVDPLNGTISGTSTIDTTGGDVTLSGSLAGNGTLNIIGSQTVTLAGLGSSSGSWGATIKGNSTLIADTVSNLSATGTYMIGSGSTFSLGTALGPSYTFNGNISDFSDSTGSGSAKFVVNASASKLVLAGTINLSTNSTTTVDAGTTLEVDNGTISNVSGGKPSDSFDVGSGTSTGTVSLLGTNSLTTVTVNAKSTLLTGSIAGSGITNYGTLGTLGSLSTPLALHYTGSLTSTNSTLLIHSNGASVDTFGTSGAPLSSATLSGLVKVTGLGSMTDVPIVYSATPIAATLGTGPGDLTTNAPTTLFMATLSFNNPLDPTELLLTTVQHTLGSFAVTPNQAAVAAPLDQIINTGNLPAAIFPIFTGLNQLPASQIPGALDELSPEVLQYSRMIAFENSTFLAQRVNGFCSDLRSGYGGLDTSAISVVAPGFNSGLGRSLGSFLAYDSPAFHQAAPNGVNYYPDGGGSSSSSSPSSSTSSSSSSSSSTPTWDPSSQVISDSPNPYMATQKPNGPDAPRISEFIGGDVILANLNQNQSGANAPSSKASYTAGDATAGISFRMASHLAVGVLFDYNHTDAKTDSLGSKTHVDSYSPGIFATYFDHGFYANGLFSFGLNKYTNNREINVIDETATSRPNGEQYVGDLDFGYDFHPDKNWVVGPTLGLTYTHLNIDSFTESGAPGADLAVNEQNADSLRSRLGGHVIFQTNTGDVLLQPNFTAMWQHEYLDSSSGITSTFTDFSSNPFTIDTAAPSRDSALLGVGLSATLNSSLTLYLNYMADIGADNYYAQSVVGGLKARF